MADIRSAVAARLLPSAAWRDLDFTTRSQHAAVDLIPLSETPDLGVLHRVSHVPLGSADSFRANHLKL